MNLVKRIALAAGFLAAVLHGAGQAQAQTPAQPQITIRYADQFPPRHLLSRLSGQAFKQLIEERSNGRVKVNLFPGEQLAKAAGMLDAVKNGIADIGTVGTVYITDRMPLTSAIELPGLFENAVPGSKAGLELAQNFLLEREYLPNGVRPLWFLAIPPYQLMFTKNNQLTSMANLSGQKLRASGAVSEFVAKVLDAVPVRMSAGDLYLGLQRGTVDGAIYNPPSVFAYKIEELLGSVTTNASLGSATFVGVINENFWKGLPEDIRQLIVQVSNEVNVKMAEGFQADNDASYEKLKSLGVKLVELSPQMQQEFAKRLLDVEKAWVAQMKTRGLAAEQTLELYRSYLKK